jgi:hypothetical protein
MDHFYNILRVFGYEAQFEETDDVVHQPAPAVLVPSSDDHEEEDDYELMVEDLVSLNASVAAAPRIRKEISPTNSNSLATSVVPPQLKKVGPQKPAASIDESDDEYPYFHPKGDDEDIQHRFPSIELREERARYLEVDTCDHLTLEEFIDTGFITPIPAFCHSLMCNASPIADEDFLWEVQELRQKYDVKTDQIAAVCKEGKWYWAVYWYRSNVESEPLIPMVNFDKL